MKSLYPMGRAVKNRLRTILKTTLSLSLLLSTPITARYVPLSLYEMEEQSYGSMKVFQVGNNFRVEYTLSKEHQDIFRDLMAHEYSDPYTQWPTYIHTAAEALRQSLPKDLVELIIRMRELNEPACILIHGMPIDEIIPATPENGERPTNKGYISEGSLMGICGLLGAEPDYDEREKDGTYINQIIPVDNEKNRGEASSLGSDIEFYVHTENVYNAPPLKFFALLGLRGDPRVHTGVMFLDDILAEFKQNPPAGMSFDEFIEEIQKPQFLMQSGPSFGDNSRAQIQAPILTRNENGERIYRFNANKDRVLGINERAQHIVEHMTRMLKDPLFKAKITTRVNLQAGDMLLFNNWEVMHGRDAFKIDKLHWRWLQRVYMLVRD